MREGAARACQAVAVRIPAHQAARIEEPWKCCLIVFGSTKTSMGRYSRPVWCSDLSRSAEPSREYEVRSLRTLQVPAIESCMVLVMAMVLFDGAKGEHQGGDAPRTTSELAHRFDVLSPLSFR